MRTPPRFLLVAESGSAATVVAAVQQSGPVEVQLAPTASELQAALAEGSDAWDAVVLVQGGPVDEVEAALYVPDDVSLVVVDGGEAVFLTDGASEAVPLDQLAAFHHAQSPAEAGGFDAGDDVTDAEVLWEDDAPPAASESAWDEDAARPAAVLPSEAPPSRSTPTSAPAPPTPMFDFQFDDISEPDVPSLRPPAEAEIQAPDLTMIVRAKPARPPSEISAPVASGAGGEVGSAAPAPTPGDVRPSVLVVEDNGDTRMLLERILRSTYEVTAVADARSALLAMNEQRFAGLVLDINLGGKETGADVLRIARSLAGYEGVFAIALTAYALPGDRERLLASGFSEYISKPFTRQSLMAALAAGVQA